jgi:CubicO group peptidase (beta-lactamase class C family)
MIDNSNGVLTMVRKAILIFLVLIINTCTTPSKNQLVEQKIHRIENGLIEFSPGNEDSETQSVDSLNLFERMGHYKVPGVSMAMVNDFQIEWSRSYGTINSVTLEPVSSQSIFQAASTTKMLVAAAALHYVGKGMLDLDSDINEYLHSWKVPENEFTREKKVTLRQLLAHQSGLPMTNFPYEDGSIPTIIQVLNGEAPAQNTAANVEFLPGSRWQYSNIGYVVAQLVLEDLMNEPLSQIIRKVIFDPLKMDVSTLVYPLEEGPRKLEALPHDSEGIVQEAALHPTAVAQGGLMTTPEELALFTRELMLAYQGRSEIVINQEMVKLMFKPELDLDPRIFGVPLSQGMGVFLFGKDEDDWGFGHPGSNYPGSTCWLMGWPEKGVGLIIMTNGNLGELLPFEIMPTLTKEYGIRNIN